MHHDKLKGAGDVGDPINPLTRFSSRAQNYQNRAPYPPELFVYLQQTCSLTPDKVIADIGSGTGYLTRVLLQSGGTVYGIEPNREMRAIAEETLGPDPRFVSLSGQAEEIPLASSSVDVVTVGQALHWFDVKKTREEFLRILKPGGWIVVVDMWARDNANPFMKACEEFRRTHFADIGKAADPPERIIQLYEGYTPERNVIQSTYTCGERVFCEGFLSSSLAPEKGTKEYESANDGLQRIFHQFQSKGVVALLFDTIIWSAQFP